LPQELLHLAATAPVFRMEGASRTYQHGCKRPAPTALEETSTAGLIRVTLDASGNVGIGASSPVTLWFCYIPASVR
jgi:hypothetical protein